MQDEKKQLLPKSSLAKILQRLGGEDEFALVDERVMQAAARAAEDMLERAMLFGSQMASSQGSSWLQVWHRGMDMLFSRCC